MLLEKLLPVVIQNSQIEGVNIIIADNASTDGSSEFISNTFPNLELINIPSNLGYAGGYNYALKNRKSEYFILLNSDAEPEAGWLEPILKIAKENADFGAAQPKLVDYFKRDKFEYAGACGGYIDAYGFPFCRGRIFGNVEYDTGQYQNETEVFWASGAAFFIKRQAWEAAHGLDEQFFAHMEEIDLCWRLQLLGYKIFVVPSSTVYHMGGGTLSNASPRKTYFNFRNGLLMLYKNLHLSEKNGVIFRRKLFDGLAGFLFLIKGKPAHVVQIIKAHKDFAKLKKSIAPTLNAKPLKDLKGTMLYSLVFSYFAKGKKHFSNQKIHF